MNLEHKKRWIAAVVGVFFLFTTYYFFRHWGIVALTVMISTVAYYEFLSFSGASRTLRLISSGTGLLLSLWLCLEFPAPLLAVYVAAAAILLRGLWETHILAPEHLAGNFLRAQSRVFGLVYMVVFTSFVPKIHALPHGPELLLFLLLLIWTGDTAAYYGGKLLGRHKLSQNVSPGRTLEGALTALIAVAVLAIACRQLGFFAHLAFWKPIFIAVLASVMAQSGDLLESLMKRAYQVKDSGSLIPGHGGVFDRFDSLILAAPFFYLLVQLSS